MIQEKSFHFFNVTRLKDFRVSVVKERESKCQVVEDHRVV